MIFTTVRSLICNLMSSNSLLAIAKHRSAFLTVYQSVKELIVFLDGLFLFFTLVSPILPKTNTF